MQKCQKIQSKIVEIKDCRKGQYCPDHSNYEVSKNNMDVTKVLKTVTSSDIRHFDENKDINNDIT